MSLKRATKIKYKDNEITLFTWRIEEVTEFREKYQDTHDIGSPSILGEFLGKDKTSYYVTATKKPVVIPQQSMSNSVKKKFTEHDELIGGLYHYLNLKTDYLGNVIENKE